MTSFPYNRRSPLSLCLLVFLFVVWPLPKSVVLGFAAKKRGGRSNGDKRSGAVASNRKGFGVQRPTWEQVVGAMETRLPPDADVQPCPCGSGDAYGDCCRPYHAGERLPETPVRVLQSRYAAFCHRIVPYIISTTHPVCQYWRDDKIKWAQELDTDGTFDAVEFVSLEIGDHDPVGDDDDSARVDFKVRIRTKDGKGDETIIKEKSLFLKQGDGWLYASGEARPEPVLKSKSEKAE